jgi:hypothetical protein
VDAVTLLFFSFQFVCAEPHRGSWRRWFFAV